MNLDWNGTFQSVECEKCAVHDGPDGTAGGRLAFILEITQRKGVTQGAICTKN